MSQVNTSATSSSQQSTQCAYKRQRLQRTLTNLDDALGYITPCKNQPVGKHNLCTLHRQYKIQQFLSTSINSESVRFQPLLFNAIGAFRSMVDVQPHDIGDRIECPGCGSLMWISEGTRCTITGAFQQCCGKGRLSELNSNVNVCPEYAHLFNRSHPKSNELKLHLRSYNSVLAMASTLCNYDQALANRSSTGMYSFVVQGQIHHAVGNVSTEVNCRRFGNIYMLDSNEQTQCRQGIFPFLDVDTLKLLQDILNRQNRYVHIYKQMGELLRAQNEEQHASPPQFTLALLNSATGNSNYSAPTAAEFAMILPDDAEQLSRQQAVTVPVDDNNKLNFIPVWSPIYDTLAYPVLFPDGREGWHSAITVKFNGRDVKPSAAEYHR